MKKNEEIELGRIESSQVCIFEEGKGSRVCAAKSSLRYITCFLRSFKTLIPLPRDGL